MIYIGKYEALPSAHRQIIHEKGNVLYLRNETSQTERSL